MWIIHPVCDFVSEQLLSERHVRLPEYKQLTASWWIFRVTGDVDCIEPWPVLLHRSREQLKTVKSTSLTSCESVLEWISQSLISCLPDQDGGWRRTRGGEVLGEEMQAGQHVQPHLRLLPCRDCRGWEDSKMLMINNKAEADRSPCLFI